MEPSEFGQKLIRRSGGAERYLRLAKIASLDSTMGRTFITMGDDEIVSARYLGSYAPEVDDTVQVYVQGSDVLVLGSTKKDSTGNGGGNGSIPSGTLIIYDAEGDIDAPRPIEPEGANFFWINVPGEPTNLGVGDLWEGQDVRDFITDPITEQELGPDAVTQQKIADNAINTAKIIDAAIVRVKIAEAAINEALIEQGAVTNTKISDDAITTPKIAANQIIGDHIVSREVNAFHIVAGSITANEIASRTITADRIGVNEITAEEIAANTITANEISAGTITANEIAAGTITANEIAAGSISANEITSGSLTSASGVFGTISADDITTGTLNANNVSITNLTVTNAMIQSVQASKITAGTITASISISSPTITGGSITGPVIQSASSGMRVRIAPAGGLANHAVQFLNSSGGFTSALYPDGNNLRIFGIADVRFDAGNVRIGTSIVLSTGNHSHNTGTRTTNSITWQGGAGPGPHYSSNCMNSSTGNAMSGSSSTSMPSGANHRHTVPNHIHTVFI